MFALPLCDKDIRVFDTSGNFTGYRSAMNSNVDNVHNLQDSVINCTSICHESNMSIDSSTTQLVSTPKPPIGIVDDKPPNPMDVVPSDLEGDYVVVGYVDNDAQQPKECFQNTEVDLKTSCGRVLLELLGNSNSLKRFDTVRYQLKIKKKSHLTLPVSDKALHDTLLAQFHCKVVAKVSALKQVIRVKKLVGLPPPALELLASYSVSKRILCTCTHTHIQPTKNIPYTHVAVDTSIVVFRPSEPHQYSINIFTLVHTHTHKHHNSMSILCVFTHTCKLSQIHTSIHVK